MGTYTIAASSVGTSRVQNVDWMSGRFTSIVVTGSSSGTFSATVEGTLDDVQMTASSNLTWAAISSAITANSSMMLYQGPLAALRLNLSALSSAVVSADITQGIGW